MTATYSLERIDDENARIVSGNHIVGTLNWTDSFWALFPSNGQRPVVFDECDALDDLDLAFSKSVSEHFNKQSTGWDFFLDPPTFVGHSDGERKCWIYICWKLVKDGANPDFREWSGREFAAANAMYRRAVRKYGDNPPDKAEELKELISA